MSVVFTKKITSKDIHENFLVIVDISHEAVLNCDIEHFRKTAQAFTACGREAKDKMVLVFNGFDDDPAEIFQIPAIRAWATKAFEALPHFFYWLTQAENNDVNILCCLANPTLIRYGTGEVKSVEQYLAEGIQSEDMPKNRLYVEVPAALEEKIARALVGYGVKIGETKHAITEKMEELMRAAV